jgi:hypothetical protein
VKNEAALRKLSERLSILDIKYSEFYEPDIGNQLTAIATEPLEDRSVLRKLDLVRD